uniref:Uncharacterized protein n=1 Tax=Arundo donax TaxID=35708 RepID=A0A0A9DB37_ARUDO
MPRLELKAHQSTPDLASKSRAPAFSLNRGSSSPRKRRSTGNQGSGAVALKPRSHLRERQNLDSRAKEPDSAAWSPIPRKKELDSVVWWSIAGKLIHRRFTSLANKLGRKGANMPFHITF